MNITLLIDNLSCTQADREIIIDRHFPTDRCLRSYEHGHTDEIWKNHIFKYDSKIIKLVIINFNGGYSFRRHLRDLVKMIPEESLIHADVVEIDNENKVERVIPFLQLIQEETNHDKYFNLIDADPEENCNFNRRLDYLRSRY